MPLPLFPIPFPHRAACAALAPGTAIAAEMHLRGHEGWLDRLRVLPVAGAGRTSVFRRSAGLGARPPAHPSRRSLRLSP